MQKEYIERKQALEILEKSLTFSEIELDKGDFRKGCIAAIQDDISNIRHIPTADVAPKSEVAREIFEEIEKALNLSKCYGDSGIYFEYDIENDIAELKKKYTGEI